MITNQVKFTSIPAGEYIENPFSYTRFPTHPVQLGQLTIGGTAPISVQSMTTTDTMNLQATVNQTIALFDAGADLVRIAAPGPKDAENLRHIKKQLEERGYDKPLVADIHFSPKAALMAIEHVEKVRINPGNFADTKRFRVRSYSDAQYEEELKRLEETFLPLVRRAKELKRVLRIGSNHGSLSDRIMNRYGDTPLGMVESALEFIRFAHQKQFYDIVVSMKSSNPQIMVQAYRLLVHHFYREDIHCPIHLGVTEAGSGRDGRMKSALGIGALLLDGIGDTIRISLTENPVEEIPAGRKILSALSQKIDENKTTNEIHTTLKQGVSQQMSSYQNIFSAFEYQRIPTKKCKIGNISFGGESPQCIFTSVNAPSLQQNNSLSEKTKKEWQKTLQNLKENGCDIVWYYNYTKELEVSPLFREANQNVGIDWVQDVGKITAQKEAYENPFTHLLSKIQNNASALNVDVPVASLLESNFLNDLEEFQSHLLNQNKALFLNCVLAQGQEEGYEWMTVLKESKILRSPSIALSILHEHDIQALLNSQSETIKSEKKNGQTNEQENLTFLYRRLLSCLSQTDENASQIILPPLLLRSSYINSIDGLNISCVTFGNLLLCGIGDGIFLELANETLMANQQFQLDILQASRLRLSKTEYISCPSCGRTLFDLEETTNRIRKRTDHLKGLKIAIMGCIVNGPGEMADADFGYVGAGPGKVHLYKEKNIVKANIDTAVADEELIKLIKECGDWVERTG